ncbi:MAG: hypothetical protein FJ137_22735, partial [Deltaproteobacteria bacterium]|nr:hypothetical protein [Deltaproteobacteria bacterium]
MAFRSSSIGVVLMLLLAPSSVWGYSGGVFSASGAGGNARCNSCHGGSLLETGTRIPNATATIDDDPIVPSLLSSFAA